jgi:hypothetical protein
MVTSPTPVGIAWRYSLCPAGVGIAKQVKINSQVNLIQNNTKIGQL